MCHMSKKDDNLEKEVPENEFSGKKFEDLTEEEMDVIQGSGSDDVKVEGISIMINLLQSKAPIKCR